MSYLISAALLFFSLGDCIQVRGFTKCDDCGHMRMCRLVMPDPRDDDQINRWLCSDCIGGD